MSLQALAGLAGIEEGHGTLKKREALVLHALTAFGLQLGECGDPQASWSQHTQKENPKHAVQGCTAQALGKR